MQSIDDKMIDLVNQIFAEISYDLAGNKEDLSVDSFKKAFLEHRKQENIKSHLQKWKAAISKDSLKHERGRRNLGNTNQKYSTIRRWKPVESSQDSDGFQTLLSKRQQRRNNREND